MIREDAIKALLRQKREEDRERHAANRATFAGWMQDKERGKKSFFIPTGETDGATPEERRARGVEALGVLLNMTAPGGEDGSEETATPGGEDGSEETATPGGEDGSEETAEPGSSAPSSAAPDIPNGGNAATTIGAYHKREKSIAERLVDKLNENSLLDDGNPWHRV